MRAYIVPVLLILAIVFIAGCASVKSPVCGDLKCDSKETVATCPVACARCGDSICSRTEVLGSCEIDCKVCGDGMCTATESQASCAADCSNVAVGLDCPNGACTDYEKVRVRAGNIETFRCYADCISVPEGTS